MSPDGQGSWTDRAEDDAPEVPQPAVVVATFAMAAGSRFEWHTHREHQLAWAPTGVLTVVTDAATWVLPPTRALWIPAELAHETLASSGRATMRSLYLRPDLCPIAWPEPRPVMAIPLLAELITYLESASLDEQRRGHIETLLLDLLEPVALTTIEVRLPAEVRAREVAQALADNPADKRTLGEWGRWVGASERTLARTWCADTGVPFGRWRTRLRLQAALPALAANEPVSTVARRVGYDTTSAFVAAFGRETGVTPATYFHDPAT
ncbi:MAG: helix-turn-helix transcriptional regulator [Acidimicrobiales bacterium]